MGAEEIMIEWLTRFFCWLKRKNRATLTTAPVKVNLGCGLCVAPGWINIDGSLNALIASLPKTVIRLAYRFSGAGSYYSERFYTATLKSHRFVHHDVRHGLPFNDNSVDFVYSSHFLEHVYNDEAVMILAESYRALKKGGLIRVCVPDLEHAILLYQRGEKRKALESYFFTHSKDHPFSRHKYMYDFELLEAMLETAGFQNIVRRSFKKGEMPDIELLDNREEETLFVEAKK